MSPIAVKVIIVYVSGFIAAPFVSSLVDGWPIVQPRKDPVDAFAAFGVSLFWPVIAVVWLAYVWWCASSWLGVRTREAVAGLFRRGREK